MGIRGLTTYVSERSDVLLEPFELKDCYLIIDGSSLSSCLYSQTKQDGVFGGDYDEYFQICQDFFLLLLKCKVTPIVLLDGSHPVKKLKTVLSRRQQQVSSLKYIDNSSLVKFFSLFFSQVFKDVMDKLKVIYAQCDFEADMEIATVARALNCPVLSNDSDFYILDVLYIPFSTMFLEAVPRKQEINKKSKYCIQCSVYSIDNFLGTFDGFDKSLLPILATLLGNDYVDNSIFKKFFRHIIMTSEDNKSYYQKRIHGVIRWLQKENFDSAINGILLHIRNKYKEKALKAINSNVAIYQKGTLSSFVYSKLVTIKEFENNALCIRNSIHLNGLPEEIKLLLYNGKINSIVLDFITLKTYFSHILAEDYYNSSCHLTCVNLIKAIHAILYRYTVSNSETFRFYLLHNKNYQAKEIDKNFSGLLIDFDLSEVLKKSQDKRKELFYEIIDFDANDIETVAGYPRDWSLFIVAYIYWIKELDEITCIHVYALLLCAVANEVIQKRVGYYETTSKFVKKNSCVLNKLKNLEVEYNNDLHDFKSKLLQVTKYECLISQKTLIPLRHTNREDKKKFSFSTIRLFNCFQSCLYHIMIINALFNCPFRPLIISNFYSGTLLFNLYTGMKKNKDIEKFGRNLLKSAPNIERVYLHLCEDLRKYSKVPPFCNSKCKTKRKKGRSRRRKKSEESTESEKSLDEISEDPDEYSDEKNPFSLLQENKVQG